MSAESEDGNWGFSGLPVLLAVDEDLEGRVVILTQGEAAEAIKWDLVSSWSIASADPEQLALLPRAWEVARVAGLERVEVVVAVVWGMKSGRKCRGLPGQGATGPDDNVRLWSVGGYCGECT
jgi:hypothetical protein